LPRMLGLWISSVVRFMDLRYFVVYGVVLRVVLCLRKALDQVYYCGAQDVLHLSYSLSPVVTNYLSQVSLPPNEKQKLSKN
jgi:hypothetical protein